MSEKQMGLPKHHHSSADLSSAASSEFEEVRLEDLGLQAGEIADWQAARAAGRSSQGRSVLSKVKEDASSEQATSSGPATTSGQDTARQPSQSDSHNADFDPFKDLESAAHKAAEMASEAAKEVSSKLFGEGSLTRLAGDVSSWWAALDSSARPAASIAGAPAPQSASRASQATTEVQQRFGLPDTEELVEQMPCTLVQAARCTHNAFTPHLAVRFGGVLYITTQHVCFHSPTETLSFAIKLERSSKIQKTMSLKKASFTTTAEAGEQPALQLRLGEGKHVTFEGFKGSGLDDALGLIEHLAQELP